jgi:hypothetical protein
MFLELCKELAVKVSAKSLHYFFLLRQRVKSRIFTKQKSCTFDASNAYDTRQSYQSSIGVKKE